MRNVSGMLVVAVVFGLAGASLAQEKLRGKIVIDGSSTVYPIAQVASELFKQTQPGVNIPIGVSGTGAGFKKFLDKDASMRTSINLASRPITPGEMKTAAEQKIEFIEVPIATDGLAVVVNKSNTFCTSLTLVELKRIWEPNSAIKNWNQVRPGFPDLPMSLYGPGTDSGTFDYFTEVVVGKARSCRNDFSPNENDTILVKGVEGDKGSLGYFGYSYYEGSKGRLNLVSIDSGDGKPVAPSMETVRTGTYHPLSRPLFIYVNKEHYDKRPELRAFVAFTLENAPKIVSHKYVNYVSLDDKAYAAVKAHVAAGVAGSRIQEHKAGTPLDIAALYQPGPGGARSGG